ncbi:hypothetical protein KQI69_09625 [Eubacterium sp. MSJ-13]|nr:hypothetical protein [Eubacterium sp. MSJ-13]MBU5479460.1 hypothetical protein [Eubacterium sp. MSJ-13]
MKEFIRKAANFICAFAVVMSPIATQHCRLYFYEAKQPEGLDEFVNTHTK